MLGEIIVVGHCPKYFSYYFWLKTGRASGSHLDKVTQWLSQGRLFHAVHTNILHWSLKEDNSRSRLFHLSQECLEEVPCFVIRFPIGSGENEANSELTNLLKIVHCSLSFLWAPFRVLERMSHRTDSNASLSNGAHLLSPQHLEMRIWIGYKCCKSYE